MDRPTSPVPVQVAQPFVSERPTLEQLRARVHKPGHRQRGNRLAIYWGRPAAVYGTWLAIRWGLSAHAVTLGAVLTTLLAALALARGGLWGWIGGALLLHIAFWLDHVDGQVARWRGTAGLDGVYFDYLYHHLWSLVVGFGLGWGVARVWEQPLGIVAGFLVALGWVLLGLHNDCRYKAFFERLKRVGAEPEERIALADPLPTGWTFQARLDHPDRPETIAASDPIDQPPLQPAPIRSLMTQAALVACEPHQVVIALTLLALVGAMVGTEAGAVLMAAYLGSMALLAPTLAVARITRAIVGGRIEQGFAAWFMAVPSPTHRRNEAEAH